MLPKVNAGIYYLDGKRTMRFKNNTGWYVKANLNDIYKKESGWPISGEFKGAALVAPLSILFWEKD